jgi:hypothetical protein
MNVLIMMLKNLLENTYHPIMYFESPLPGENQPVIRFKSKGHRTNGFKNKQDAINSIKPEIIDRLGDEYNIIKELDDVIPWTGLDIPADVQLRQLPTTAVDPQSQATDG